MTQDNIIFYRYLKHLEITSVEPTYKDLCKLQAAQIVKFPFENISKIILHNEENLNGLVNFTKHLDNSIQYGFGGTCYACNYYFNSLLKHLGFKAELHGANMKFGEDVHLVNKVRIDKKEYLVDVGYGAPFYSPLHLNNRTEQIQWGDLEYKLNVDEDKTRILVLKKSENIHGYSVNKNPRSIGEFSKIIKDSYDESNDFMRILRIIRYFDNYSIELKNFEYTIHKGGQSIKKYVDNIDELEEVMAKHFRLPDLPIRKAYEIIHSKKFI